MLGKIYAATVLSSFVLAIAQTAISVQMKSGDSAQVIGGLIGAFIAMSIRIVLIVFYIIAVKRYGKLIASTADFETANTLG